MKTATPKAGPPATRAALVARIKALARQRGVRTLSRRDLEAATGLGYRRLIRHFASPAALLKACGLKPFTRRSDMSDETLLTAMHEAFTAEGGFVEGQRFDRACSHGRQAYKSRWRSWAAALCAYRDWLQAHHPDSALLPTLATRCPDDGGQVAWEGCGGARFGTPLSLPGLQHAPTNEMGVVFLFGALAPALGYTVESLSPSFPDCAAKRRLRGPGERWERVRVEFEFRSRNFLAHKHDPKQCDVIVCWKNDWPECPLEVLELQREVRNLAAGGAVPPARNAGAGDTI